MTGETLRALNAKPRKMASATKAAECCDAASQHPDHGAALGRLRRIQGQLKGIEKMVLDRRYCADILVQCRAAGSALRAFEGVVLEGHLRECVKTALESKDRKESEKKITELMDLFRRD